MSSADELRALVEEHLARLALSVDLSELERAVRYAFAEGGKRVRPVICLATGEAAGAVPVDILPAAAAVELVHSFSLVHDDLPALDNDDVRRGLPSVWARFGEADAILAGDALLAEAVRQALSYETPHVARELMEATLGMIGGQHLDIHGAEHDLAALHRLKTGRLFAASVGCALWAAGVPEAEQLRGGRSATSSASCSRSSTTCWTRTATSSSTALTNARAMAQEAASRAHACLDAVPADTTVLGEIVTDLAVRTR